MEFEEIKEKLGIKKEEDIEIEDYELPYTLNPDWIFQPADDTVLMKWRQCVNQNDDNFIGYYI